jgi:hypothetical protein
MTIVNQSIKRTVQGNGVQTVFDYNFLIPTADTAELWFLDDVTGDTYLLPASSWSLSGANNPLGGTFTYPRNAGQQPLQDTQSLTLVRKVPNTQITSLQNQSGFQPRAVESALDWIVMQIQQFVDEVGRSIRVPLAEQGLPELLPAGFRSNTILGFDVNGLPSLLPIQPDNNTTVIAQGSTFARTLAARFADTVNVLDHGAVPDWNGTSGTDNTAAFASAFAYASVSGKLVTVPYGDYYVGSPIWLQEGAQGLVMQGTIWAPGGFTVLTLGGNIATRNQNKTLYGPLRVMRTSQSDWSTEADIGVKLWNLDNCVVMLERVEKFCINVQVASDLRGVEDSDFYYGRIIDGKVGVDFRTFNPGPNSYVNSARHFGGHFACSSATNQGVNRFGVRFSRDLPGDYDLHNSHVFYGPAFELQTVGGQLAIPFLIEVAGRSVIARDMRMEACSPYAAWHSDAMNDCLYEISFVGTYGTYVNVLYTGATRAGGTIVMRHQTLAAQHSPRLIAAVENVRNAAFRDVHQTANGVGFEGLGIMSSNPSGPPTTMSGLIFSGLTLMTLNANDVTLPTSRAVGFVVDLKNPTIDAGIAKELTLAAEGRELRLIVAQFDASENALDNTHPILLSNANALWNQSFSGNTNYWWEMNTNLDQTSGGYPLFYWQRITFAPACRYAFVGVRGGSSGEAPIPADLKAIRLYASALFAPQILAGGSRDWGSRDMQASEAWSVPVLSPGATTTFDITVPGLRGGDFVQAGFAKASGFQNGGVVFHAVQGGTASTNQVRVTAQNLSAGTITVGDGTLFVRGKRPKL